MIPRQKRNVVYAMTAIVCVLFFLLALAVPELTGGCAAVFGAVTLLLLCVILCLAISWSRCPHCRTCLAVQIFLLNKVSFPCPHCGEQVEIR